VLKESSISAKDRFVDKDADLSDICATVVGQQGVREKFKGSSTRPELLFYLNNFEWRLDGGGRLISAAVRPVAGSARNLFRMFVTAILRG